MVAKTESSVHYDPYDFDIDVDPYPLWKRMRDEVPLYFNDKCRVRGSRRRDQEADKG